jgi:sarcosine oxidase subunit gamma
VAEGNLASRSPLFGFSEDFGGLSIAEVNDLDIVSLAVPLGGAEALAKAVTSAYGVKLPTVGQSLSAETGNARFLGLARDQVFLFFDDTGMDPVGAVTEKLSGTAYLTDQSDAWALLRITGPNCRAALERICPLDLHPSAFAVGAVARTVMEHLNVIILREAPDAFLLMSPRSSAASFLHAVTTSAENIAPASQ